MLIVHGRTDSPTVVLSVAEVVSEGLSFLGVVSASAAVSEVVSVADSWVAVWAWATWV